ncbi:MAG TPA: hypothetical protein VML55_11250 [Planctomycetaceae bacterium]|nr:hypothetical protein [Planctomycetaceae bacterium]
MTSGTRTPGGEQGRQRQPHPTDGADPQKVAPSQAITQPLVRSPDNKHRFDLRRKAF